MFSGRSGVYVAVGAIAGAAVRWAVSEIVDPATAWPWATFVVNMVGACALGLVLAVTRHGVDAQTEDPVRLALGTGFCGALTTFSALAVEVAQLIRDDRTSLSAGYLAASLAAGLAAFLVGRHLGDRRIGAREGLT